jgi:chromosomal replication initiation ATPase DnaA
MTHTNDTIERILAGVCATYDVTRWDLVGHCRVKKIVAARDAAVVALRRLTIMSTPEIAAVMGYNSHTCVLAALKRAEQYATAAKAGLAEVLTADHVPGAGKMVAPAEKRKRNVGKFVDLLRNRMDRRVVDA